MNFKDLMRVTLALAGVGAAILAVPARAQLVKIDGSSTVFPITEAVAEDFQRSTKGKVKVTVGISGTGGGFKKFCRGETDISDASRPILKSEMEACRAAGVQYYELPIAYDALTVVINPRERLDQDAHAGGSQEDVGAERPEQSEDLEAGEPGLAGPAAQAVRPGRGFRDLRLLHRGGERQIQGEPRRLHRQRGRQRAGAGRVARRQRAGLLRIRLLHREQGQAQGGSHRACRGPAGRGAVHGERDHRQVSSRCRAPSSSTSTRSPTSVPRCSSSSSTT